MAEEFVKKEVFDARMDRMEALLEKAVFEMKADNEKLRSDVNAAVSEMKADNERLRSEMKENIAGLEKNFTELRGEVRALDARVDALQTWQYWQIAWIGILFASVALIPMVAQYLRRKSESFTRTDAPRILLDRSVNPNRAGNR